MEKKMYYPTEEDVDFVVELITHAIKELIKRDSDIFSLDPTIEDTKDDELAIRDRKLFEVTICHRLAVYLEEKLKGSKYTNHFVDLEYNRFYVHPKEVETALGSLIARPDIIIHTRMNEQGDPQHYLVIEAKKAAITDHDLGKLFGFMDDPRYYYRFALALSYCDDDHVTGTLFYHTPEGREEYSIMMAHY